MKVCKGCGASKALDEFYNAKDNKDGKQGKCKVCMNAATAAWYAANPDVNKAKGKAQRKRENSSEDRRLQALERRRAWREKKAAASKDDKCRRCGFVPEDLCQLTVDHIDRDHSNNDKDNLQTLCGNCHYLKTKVEMTTPEKLKFLNLIP
jgi:hypothetical protein